MKKILTLFGIALMCYTAYADLSYQTKDVDRFVDDTGDTMTGSLTFATNVDGRIVFLAWQEDPLGSQITNNLVTTTNGWTLSPGLFWTNLLDTVTNEVTGLFEPLTNINSVMAYDLTINSTNYVLFKSSNDFYHIALGYDESIDTCASNALTTIAGTYLGVGQFYSNAVLTVNATTNTPYSISTNSTYTVVTNTIYSTSNQFFYVFNNVTNQFGDSSTATNLAYIAALAHDTEISNAVLTATLGTNDVVDIAGAVGIVQFSDSTPESAYVSKDIALNAGSIVTTGTVDIIKVDSNDGIVNYDIVENVMAWKWSGTVAASIDFDGQDVVVSDDLTVDDFASLDSARIGATATDPGTGNLYVENDITAVSNITMHGEISSANAYAFIASTNSAGTTYSVTTTFQHLGDFTVYETNLVSCTSSNMTIQSSGLYDVYFSISGYGPATSPHFAVCFHTNGVETVIRQRVDTETTDAMTSSSGGLIRLSVNDVVDLRIKSDDTDNYDVIGIQFKIVKIRN